MVSEAECCAAYIDSRPEPYSREVPVGNCLLEADATLTSGAHGPLAWSADWLCSPPDSSREQLVECKQSPTFTGLGQLLLYDYLRRRDRELVWKKYEARGTAWETKSATSDFDSHISAETTGNSKHSYHPKPRLSEIDRSLVVCELEAADAPLLSVCPALDIDVKYPDAGQWRSLDPAMTQADAPSEHPPLESWLETTSSPTLDSPDEESLAGKFCEGLSSLYGFEDVRPYREIPIGSRLYSSQSSTLRADLVVKADDYWILAEVKRTESPHSTRAFQKAFGQTVGYATLFQKEWELDSGTIIPVVVQNPVAIIGDLYRRDRYGADHSKMFHSAVADTTQPVIIGPAVDFGFP